MYSFSPSDRHLAHVLALVVLFAIAAVGCDDQTGPVDDVLEVDQASNADAAGDADVDPCEGITRAAHTEVCPYEVREAARGVPGRDVAGDRG